MEGKFIFEFTSVGRLTTSFIESFRLSFPYFADPTKYTDARISFYAELAKVMMDEEVWGDTYPYGLQLFIAHNLMAEDMRLLMALGGAGAGFGPIMGTMRSVDGVTYSNKYMMGFYRNAGFWGTTPYGQQYYDLVMIIGNRPTQYWSKARVYPRYRSRWY